MELSVLFEPDPAWLPQVAALHHEALSSRSFITSFGHAFLVRLYDDLLSRRVCFVVAAREGSEVLGFILGSTDSSWIMSTVAMRPHAYARYLVPAMLRHPRLVLDTLESLSYASRAGEDVPAELVVVAVLGEHRSRGIGARLLGVLEDEFRRRGVVRYKVTVHRAMEGANRFYLANGMTLHKTFRLRGLDWNTYVKDLAPGGPG